MLINIEKTNALDKVKILKEVSQEKYHFMTELIDNPIDLLTTHKQILSYIEMGVAIPAGIIRKYHIKEVEILTCGYCDSEFEKGTGGNYGENGDVCINCFEGLS